MKIVPDPTAGAAANASAGASASPSKPRASLSAHAAASLETYSSSPASSGRVIPVQPETNVTFRRDQNGRIYYVLTDGKSGKELQEIPPEQVRSVGQGIEEYLKREGAQKDTARVELKA